MTVYANSNFSGPLVSVNNIKGINAIPVSLALNTAKVWTHNLGQTPVGVLNFVNSNTNGGKLDTTVAVTSNANAITLTPGPAVDLVCVVIWTLPIGSQNGVPVTNFV